MTTFDATFATPIHWIVEQLEHLPTLPGRRAVVLVNAERQAHALRREVCVGLDRPQLLAGVLLLRPAELAREILLRTGRVRLPGWEAVRRLRILHLFASGGLAAELRYFSPDQLRTGQGYVEAFARTIADLEDSGIDPELAASLADTLFTEEPFAAGRLHDVALTWSRADADRGARATRPQLLGEAAAVLVATPDIIAPLGPIFTALTESPSTTLLRFLHALPGCHAILQDARPLRAETQRWRSSVPLQPASVAGHTVAAAPPSSPATPVAPGPPVVPGTQLLLFASPRPSVGAVFIQNRSHPDELRARQDAADDTAIPVASELHLLQRFLFEVPQTLTDPQRPRSAGADGSVDLEEHPSLEEEIEAAATWVTEQLSAGIAAEEIALIVPELDPYATLLTDRLRRLTNSAPTALDSYVEGGLALVESPAGLRLQTLLTALARSLEAEATIRLLPALRGADQGNEELSRALSPSRAASIVYGAGIVGGSPADSSGLGEWVPRLTRRRDTLRALVEAGEAPTPESSDEPDKRRHTVDRQQVQRRLNEINAVLPAVTALQLLAEDILGGASLRITWERIRTFAKTWLRLPPAPPNLLATLAEQLQPLLADPIATSVTDLAALHFLIEVLRRERRPMGRFGEARIFIGTPTHAAGLSFAAVRLLGLAEGALPHTPHDDPIVPDELRKRIEEVARARGTDVVVPRLADQVLDDIHAAFRVISATRQRLALTAPRQWIDRSEREVSGIMLEVATALGRRLAGHTDEGDVPTAARLRAVYLNPGRASRRRAAGERPLSPRTQLADMPQPSPDGIAVPAGWMRSALALDRVHALSAGRRDSALTGIDGVVTEAWAAVPPPGLVPQRPMSASALAILLSCPHRFLLERILHLNEPAARPSTDAIDPIAYGALFHAAAERFFHTAGAALCAHEGNVDEWVARAQAVAAAQFDQLRDEYPLRGTDAIERERHRLLRQTEQLVRDEWRRPVREYVDSELNFGQPTPVCLAVEGGELYVRGAIDRLDRLPTGGLSVRDLKTGRVHDLGEDPMNAGRDLQIGLYTLALEALGNGSAGETAAHVVEAAYVHPSAAQEEDRSFVGAELALLRRRTHNWLHVAHDLLSAGNFPRTPEPNDCRYCPFVPACGDSAQQRSAAKLRSLPDGHPLHSFVRFKEESRRDEG